MSDFPNREKDRPPVRLVNLTGHPVTLIGAWNVTTLPVDGRARVDSKMRMVDRLVVPSGIPGLDDWFIPVLEVAETSGVIGLPDPIDGCVFIVSGIVASHESVRGRGDVVTVSRLERVGGKVEGARALMRIR